MGLAQTQQVLARLYTNTQLRERYFVNPQVVGMEMGLSRDEAQQLAEISAQQTNIFANSLKWKRLGEVWEMLPRTAKTMGKDFTTWFWRYAETQIPVGMAKHRQDAIAFADFIIKIAKDEDIQPSWIVDLVRYEKTWLLTDKPTSCLQICWLRHEIHRDFRKQPAIALWLRLGKHSPLHHIVRSLPFPS